MIEALIVGFLVLVAAQLVRIELESRRSERREAELFKIIRSLENRLSAKDLTGFMALEDTDRGRAAPPQKASAQQLMEHALDAGYTNGS